MPTVLTGAGCEVPGGGAVTVRWDDLPEKVRERAVDPNPKRRRAKAAPARFRCGGLDGCGEIIEGSAEKAQRHADAHGAHRIETMFEEETGA